MIKTPAISTIHAVLDRNGPVKRGKRRRHKARGTPLAAFHFLQQQERFEVEEQNWLVSFLDYDLGFFDNERGRVRSRVEPGPNPFVTDKVLTMSPV